MEKIRNIQAVIFDWAGTIIDYGCRAPSHVFVEVFNKYGIKISMDDARGPMGLAKKDHVKALTELLHVREAWEMVYDSPISEKDIDDIYSDLEPNLAKVVQDYADPIPGVVELFETLRGQGVKIGSTTGYVDKMMENIIPLVTIKGVNPDSIVTSSDVPQGRPLPFMCFLNAIKLQVSPMWKMVKIGDTVADIKEGLNAGMWTVGFTKSGNEVGLTEEEIKNCDPATLNMKIEKAKTKLQNAGAHFIVEGPWECLPVLEEINQRIENNEKP